MNIVKLYQHARQLHENTPRNSRSLQANLAQSSHLPTSLLVRIESGPNVLCPPRILDQVPVIIDGSVLLGVWHFSGFLNKPIVVGRADTRGSFRRATWHVLPRDFYGNHIPRFQERICDWYEVDYLPALRGKTCVGIALYIWRALAIVD